MSEKFAFGREVMGPIVGEFCLRLWSTASQFASPQDAVLLFCARGGLRQLLAYERFLTATGLTSPLRAEPLMVSRLAAVRPALVRGVAEGAPDLLPAAALALTREFPRASVAEVVTAVSGVGIEAGGPRWQETFSARGVAELLLDPDGAEAVKAMAEQSDLFGRHLAGRLAGASHAVLVDTGLYGTTRDLLATGFPELATSSLLFGRSFKPGTPADSRTFGLSAHAQEYSVLDRRSVVLRYWHFVEAFFEPDLQSVTRFTDTGGEPRSDLEVDGWAENLQGPADGLFAGALAYLDALPHGEAWRVVAAADRAWTVLHRAVVRPGPEDVAVLETSERTPGFGRTGSWGLSSGRGVLDILRSDGMWREGELARTARFTRRPVQSAVQAAYAGRGLHRSLGRRLGR